MPIQIAGAYKGTNIGPVKDLAYAYPNGADLKPGSRLHSEIINKVTRMADDSYAVMSKRHKKWNEIDETLKVYIPTDQVEKLIKYQDKRKPVSIVVPYSYATKETMMSYLTKAYLTDTVFQFEGYGPEDTIGAKLLELTVNQQVNRFKSVLEMHTTLSDCLSYGLGASTLNWTERWGKRPVVREQPNFSRFGNPLSTNKLRENVDALLFEGNEVIAIDPYRYLPDPNVSIHNVQHGEFVGWIEFKSLYKLLADEQTDASTFNVKYLKDQPFVEARSKYSTDASRRIAKRDEASTNSSTNYVTLINMYVTLIPKDWKLPFSEDNPRGDYPEIWLFTVANELIVIKASPLGLNHNQYPIAIAAPDYDGYSVTPLSKMELVGGLQTTLNWLFNSHIANVRKAINDMLIVDPSLVNMEDMENPEPGKLIRLRRSAWGHGVENVVKQLAVTDITRGNMADVPVVMDLMQKALGTSDATMGIQRSRGERVTAAEFGGTQENAISRLEHMGRLISRQYFMDLAYFHASHTQQLMSQDVYVKAVGDWEDVLLEEFSQGGFDPSKPMKVSVFDILADYDIVYKDGATVGATALENDFWTKSFQSILSSDKLGEFNAGKIFKHLARMNGAKNVNDFVNKGGGIAGAQVLPTADVQQQAQAGNLVPLAMGDMGF